MMTVVLQPMRCAGIDYSRGQMLDTGGLHPTLEQQLIDQDHPAGGARRGRDAPSGVGRTSARDTNTKSCIEAWQSQTTDDALTCQTPSRR